MAFLDLGLASPTDGRNEGDLIPLMQTRFGGNEFEVHRNHGIVRITAQGRMLLAVLGKELSGCRALGKIEFDLRDSYDIFNGSEKLRPDLHTNGLLQ
jgi:hypothetical protein